MSTPPSPPLESIAVSIPNTHGSFEQKRCCENSLLTGTAMTPSVASASLAIKPLSLRSPAVMRLISSREKPLVQPPSMSKQSWGWTELGNGSTYWVWIISGRLSAVSPMCWIWAYKFSKRSSR